MTIQPIMRFVVRGNSPSDGLVIGLRLTGSEDLLKPNHAYDLVECDGEIVLKDLGESCVAPSNARAEDQTVEYLTWSRDVNSLLRERGNWIFLTKDEAREELARLAEKRGDR